jgi:hypothetical protein
MFIVANKMLICIFYIMLTIIIVRIFSVIIGACIVKYCYIMPDLSRESVHAFWHEYDARILYRIVSSIEAAESWVTSGPEIEQLLKDLGDVLDSPINVSDLNQETLVKLLTSVPFSQALRLMHSIEGKRPGSISEVLIWAEQQKSPPDSPEKIFLRRNVVFERLQLCARIFSPERLNLVKKSLEVKIS